ncbi:MAG: cytidine deaminase [Ferruginibacter sp.]
MKEQVTFTYESFDDISELEARDADLVELARKATEKAYAPYSNFRVAAVARMENGEIVYGTNQENASYPVGICAERVLLSSASMLHTNIPIDTIAISYHNQNGESNRPVSPCGICRQSLSEYEDRTGKPIRLILSGMEGRIVVLESAGKLLPLSFGGADLK